MIDAMMIANRRLQHQQVHRKSARTRTHDANTICVELLKHRAGRNHAATDQAGDGRVTIFLSTLPKNPPHQTALLPE
jgi:hypothetical protein